MSRWFAHATALLPRVRCVSFDVFDTAVLRGVRRPEDVFALLARQLGTPAFARDRERAEHRARAQAWADRRSGEVTLREIYAHCTGPLPADELMRLELATEQRVCRRNQEVFALYERCRALGKQVIFASDMYLPAAAIAEILGTHGYAADRLYVSNEIGHSKAAGTLYRHMLADLGLPGAAVLHLGDNPHSDVRMARQAGLRALHYPRHGWWSSLLSKLATTVGRKSW